MTHLDSHRGERRSADTAKMIEVQSGKPTMARHTVNQSFCGLSSESFVPFGSKARLLRTC